MQRICRLSCMLIIIGIILGALQVHIENTFVVNAEDYQESTLENDDDYLDSPIEFTHIYPTSVTYYKDSYSKSKYENVSYRIEDNRLIIKIPYSVSVNNLVNSKIDFDINDGNWELVSYNKEVSEYADVLEHNKNVSMNCVTSASGNNLDLTREPVIRITLNDGKSEEYIINTEYVTGDLPVLYIRTCDGEGIDSRDEYKDAYLELNGEKYNIEVKGRGNVSWWGYRQKSYLIKFDDKISLFGCTPSDKYSILSTYGDPSLVRNVVSMKMASELDNMEFTPKQCSIDMFIDGAYVGVFTFSEKIDVGMDKVNLFSDYSYEESKTAYSEENPYDELAFMLELGGYSKGAGGTSLNHFSSSHIRDVYIKYPEEEKLDSETSDLIKSYIRTVDNVLTSGKYEGYIEIDSWVDWFILMELTNNTDSAFQRSTYLYKRPGSALYLGPVWDFDKAFGNYGMDNPDFDTWCCAESDYDVFQFNVFHYLYMSNAFMGKVKIRWDEKKNILREVGLDELDDAVDDIAFSRFYNDKLYNRSGIWSISRVEKIINKRYNWIDYSLHEADYNRHPDRPTIVWDPKKDEEEIKEEIIEETEIYKDNLEMDEVEE